MRDAVGAKNAEAPWPPAPAISACTPVHSRIIDDNYYADQIDAATLSLQLHTIAKQGKSNNMNKDEASARAISIVQEIAQVTGLQPVIDFAKTIKNGTSHVEAAMLEINGTAQVVSKPPLSHWVLPVHNSRLPRKRSVQNWTASTSQRTQR